MPGTISKISLLLSITDESYDSALSSGYILSLQLGSDGLSFCILDSERNKFIALHVFSFQKSSGASGYFEKIKEILETSGMLKISEYKQVHACIVNSRSTLVPGPLFEKDKLHDYFTFNQELSEGELLYADHLKITDAYNIYSISANVEKELKAHFPSVRIHHFSTSLIESVLMENKNQDSKKLYLHVKPSHFEVIVLEGSSLILYNSFEYQAAGDFIYYVLFICEQLKLNPENIDTVLTGEIEKNSAVYSMLYKYIRNIRFGKRLSVYEYSYGFNEIPSHFHYSLLAQVLPF